jgi:tRNA-Thr(GGU) m(6)t(6)A37 methyltransferase TsaA
MKILFKPIGYVHCKLKDSSEAPRHHSISDVEGVIELNPDLVEGLYKIEERDHLVILFYFHKNGKYYEDESGEIAYEGYRSDVPLHQVPPSSKEEKGVFSTCSPNRPNPIGMDIVELIKIEGNQLHVKNIDMLDGTPVLDIKPYKPLDCNKNKPWVL